MQEMYSKVKASINAQGGPSMNDHRQCLYRGPKGRKCAIGCLIPDDQYNPSIEGSAIVAPSIIDETPENLSVFTDLQRQADGTHIPLLFLSRLQRAHDYSALKEDFLQSFNIHMAEVASTYSLKDE